MSIRTSEELEQWFKENKEKRLKRLAEEKQKQKEAKERQQRLKKMADELLKAVEEKTPQKPQKEPNRTPLAAFHIYNSRHIEREADYTHLYKTREELQEAEKRGEGKINWDKWDELVSKTKEDINKALKGHKEPPKVRGYNKIGTVYIYDRELKLIGEFKSLYQAAKVIKLKEQSLKYLLQTNLPHKKLGITVLQHKLTYEGL